MRTSLDMLQFWKRSSHKDKNNPDSPTTNSPPTSPCLSNGDVSNSLNNFESGILAHLDDEGLCDLNDSDAPATVSRLSKSLRQVLADKAALGYFVQFLDAHDSTVYLRCYLDIDSFRTAALLQEQERETQAGVGDHEPVDQVCSTIITRDQLETSDLRLLSPLPSSRAEHDSLSVSTDCDSYTGDSASLCDFTSVDIADTSYRLHKLDLNKRREKTRVITDDALGIFKKYIAQEAPNQIGCPEGLRNDIIEAICTESGIGAYCFDKIQNYVFEVMQNKFFDNYLRSHYSCKYQIDVLTSGNIVLQDILYNESILFYFMEYLEQENCCSLLEFWLAASNFRLQFTSAEDEAQNDAIILYDKYFSLQAICPLGFSDKIRFLVEQNICAENGPNCDCFSQPVRIIENFLDKNYLKPFLSSQLYFKYLSELISTVQTNGYSNITLKSKHTLSECSSELSTNTNDTPTNIPRKITKQRTDMNIDTRQLYDPDSLWKRRKTRRLSFGRITDLGRFETDVEPEPDKKTESRIARAMKRLVNLEEHKTKEEMAWQVAEMIVKDITSVTLADPGLQS